MPSTRKKTLRGKGKSTQKECEAQGIERCVRGPGQFEKGKTSDMAFPATKRKREKSPFGAEEGRRKKKAEEGRVCPTKVKAKKVTEKA